LGGRYYLFFLFCFDLLYVKGVVMSKNNPIGSTDPIDFYQNCHNLDIAMNDLKSDIWIDRFGIKRPTINAIQKRFSWASKFSYYSAKMAAGEKVSIAAYGDSTVDGFATTPWVGNYTNNGDAVGNNDHGLDAPNAYPTVLQGFLREMFNNNKIDVFNAGYSGKSLADGWAIKNYDKAIIENPHYGIPDIVFIDFGLNDARPEGSQIETFRVELIMLIDKISSYGSLPVILTCDPVLRNYDTANAVFNREIIQQIDMVKYHVAMLKNIPLITKGEQLRDWANNNQDGYRWFEEQSTDVNGDGDFGSGDDVGLHFKNTGHRIKAGIIAKEFYSATVNLVDENEIITSSDARSNSFGNFLLTLSGNSSSNNKQGFNFKVDYKDPNSIHKPAGPRSPMSTIWVWNEIPGAEVIYNGICGEGWGTDDPSRPIANPLPPAIVIKHLVDNEEHTKIPPTVGFRYSGFLKPSDVPYPAGKLKYGLNKIQYLCGDLEHYDRGSKSIFFYGFFEFRKPTSPSLKTPMIKHFQGGVDGIEAPTDAPSFGVMDNEKLVFLIEADIPIGCGVNLLSSSTFSGVGAGKPDGYGSKQTTSIYRHDATKFRLCNAKLGVITKEMVSLPVNVAFTPVLNAGLVSLRIEISRVFDENNAGGGKQVVSIYDGFMNKPEKLLQTTNITAPSDIPVLMAGVLGGFYSNKTLNTSGGNVLIKTFTAFKE
jgi:GDSL-like Lipase/Acylhydrolase family